MAIPALQQPAQERTLPWWTWVAGLLILHAGSQISVLFKIDHGISAIYLPTALGVVLVNWWGPRKIIPLVYLNAVGSSFLWGIPDVKDWFIYSIPETIMVFLSWYLFTVVAKGKYWLPDIQNLLKFLLFGIILPIIPELLILETLFIAIGGHTPESFAFDFLRNCLGEFTSGFGIALPLMYYGTPLMQRLKLTRYHHRIFNRRISLSQYQWIELIFVFCLLLSFVFIIDFKRYWFVYGVFSLYAAIRFGFGIATLTNLYIYLVTYILPYMLSKGQAINLRNDKYMVDVFLGISVLYVFAAVVGRVISDLMGIERKLMNRNKELEVANAEMDRFVYSVSHDLSAPLKSILGLVNVGRFDTTESQQYFGKIEKSVNKMEAFINEILDYSRNKRLSVVAEQIKLKELCTEILDNLKYTEGFQAIKVDMTGIEQNEILNDKTRIKIILNNLLSNAIKYQKNMPDHQPQIKISAYKMNASVIIEVEDNGDGIRPEFQPRIFEMFYRGTDKSKGSGLGLYIAKEAAEKLNAILMVSSDYGVGSKFKLVIN
jgi:two-component system, sensor histidine kinase